MRPFNWNRDLVRSTQPEAGMPPDEGNEATGPHEGGDRQDAGGGGGPVQKPDEDQPDFPPGNANPAMGID